MNDWNPENNGRCGTSLTMSIHCQLNAGHTGIHLREDPATLKCLAWDNEGHLVYPSIGGTK